jgi:hypothetical protein
MRLDLLIVVQRLPADPQRLGQAGLDGAELDRLGEKELSGHLVAEVRRLDRKVAAIEHGPTLAGVLELQSQPLAQGDAVAFVLRDRGGILERDRLLHGWGPRGSRRVHYVHQWSI